MIEHVIEAMVDAVLVVDVDGRVSHANSAAARITGYTPAQLRAMPVGTLLVDDTSGLRSVVRRKIEHGDVMRKEESWLVARDGKRIPVSVTGSAVHADDGRVSGIVLVARDVRDVRRLLAEKEEEIQRRRQAEAMLGTLAGGVGHELRNIAQVHVAAVDELASALAAGEDVTEIARALLPDLERVGEHISTHGHRLMQLAQPEPDRLEHLDLRMIIEDVVMMLRGAGKLRRLDVKLDLPPNALVVHVNRVRVEQVLFNLVVNAADAIGDVVGGITLRAWAIDHGARASRVGCSVADTGCGIAPELLDKVFQPLFTTKGANGTGFGLPVARDIVAHYGGELRVASQLGAGTTFTFDLPR